MGVETSTPEFFIAYGAALAFASSWRFPSGSIGLCLFWKVTGLILL